MELILLASLAVIIALVLVIVLRRRRKHQLAADAKALRFERRKAQRERIPKVSSNLCGSSVVSANAITRISLTD